MLASRGMQGILRRKLGPSVAVRRIMWGLFRVRVLPTPELWTTAKVYHTEQFIPPQQQALHVPRYFTLDVL